MYRNGLSRIKVAGHSDHRWCAKVDHSNGNDAVRLLGILMALVGGVGVVHSVRGTLANGRPKDVGYALVSIAASVLALLGVALAFVPGFLG